MIKSNRILWVKAIDNANVRELDENGAVFRVGQIRIVGKRWDSDSNKYIVLPEGQRILYHSHYIKCLKEGTLLAADVETAQSCNVAYHGN